MVSAASSEFSNLMLCGFGSDSSCEMQNLTELTSHENFGLVQESLSDLLSIFLACACAACFSFMIVMECCRFSFSVFARFVDLFMSG